MGVVIPLFNRDPSEDIPLTQEEKVKMTLLKNSIEALKREEGSIEEAISTKCKDEIDRLRVVSLKISNLESELERIRHSARKKPKSF
jgi:hypothetical protein